MVRASGVEILAMSATVGNLAELSQFLGADTFCGTHRPVQLQELVKLGNRLFPLSSIRDRSYRGARVLPYKSEDEHLVVLVKEVAPAGGVLVFCSSRGQCEVTATMLGRALKGADDEALIQRRTALAAALALAAGVHTQRSVAAGVAYHHAGLSYEERAVLEEAFSAQTLCVLACTPTLASGVNLPTSRVIIRSPRLGGDLLAPSLYRQMTGRAGRTGLVGSGDSIFCIPNDEETRARLREYTLGEEIEPCLSHLLGFAPKDLPSDPPAPTRIILGAIASGLVGTSEELVRWCFRGDEECS